jgi:hypothetical protein
LLIADFFFLNLACLPLKAGIMKITRMAEIYML